MDSKRTLVEKIQRQLEGAWPSSTDALFTFRYVLGYVNDAIASLAKRSALENSNLEGVTYANDEFNVEYKGELVQKDASGQFYVELPQMPIGLPKGRGLVRVTPGNNYKSVTFKPIASKDVSQALSLPEVFNKSFYYITSGQIRFISCKGLFPKTVDIVMVSSGVNDLDADLLIPEDAQADIVDIVFNRLMKRESLDVTNDGIPAESSGVR